MRCLVIFSLLALLSSGIESASLPYQDGYEWHFNKAGVHLDLLLKDQTSLLVGGKVHVELPISAVWKLLEEENQLLKPLVIAIEKTTLGRIFDVMTVKADITFSAEKVLEGIFDTAVDYTIVHKDGTEEKATLIITGKNESRKLITTVEVMTKSLETSSNQIIFPITMVITCNWPNAHTVTIKGSFGNILINIETDINEVSCKGVWEYLGTQYKYSTVLSIKEKSLTVTYQKPTEEPKKVVLQFNVLNGYPRIEITGNVPTCRWFESGIFKTEVIVNSLYDIEIKHIHNGIELFKFNITISNGKIDMTIKYGLTHKTQMVIVYEYMKMIQIEFPLTNTWLSGNRNLGIELQYQPTNEAGGLIKGGNIKIVVMRDAVPVMKIGGYYGLTIDATKFEILLNDVYVTLMKPIAGISFSEVKFFGKIFFDRVNKNGLMHKFSVETKFEKDGEEMFNILLTTVETPYRLHIFYPYLLKNILNIHNVEYVEITHGHVVVGEETTITTTCNLTSKKLIGKITPTMISYELLDGDVSLVKYLNEITKLDVGTSTYLLEGKTSILDHSNHQCLLPGVLCFTDLTTTYHIEVVDLASGKINVKVQVTKDALEILHVEINNVEVPYKIIVNAQVLYFDIIAEYETTTKEWKVLINLKNKKNVVTVKPTIENKFEVAVNGIPLLKLTLVKNKLKVTTIIKGFPAVTATIAWKTLSMFENTLGLELLYGKIVHKTVLGWNINMLKKAFIDIKLIGSGTILGSYEVFHHLNWNILNMKNIDLESKSKVLCTGVNFLTTPLLTKGKLTIQDFVIDMLLVEKFKNKPYTLVFKTKPLKIALLPFFEYP